MNPVFWALIVWISICLALFVGAWLGWQAHFQKNEESFRVVHQLKCWPESFQSIGDRRKTFEVRMDDRGYEIGHWLQLREFNPSYKPNEYTGRSISVKVTYVLRGPVRFGAQRVLIPDGVVVLGIEEG